MEIFYFSLSCVILPSLLCDLIGLYIYFFIAAFKIYWKTLSREKLLKFESVLIFLSFLYFTYKGILDSIRKERTTILPNAYAILTGLTKSAE
jgi:hypothetical protein